VTTGEEAVEICLTHVGSTVLSLLAWQQWEGVQEEDAKEGIPPEAFSIDDFSCVVAFL
jgi:hypothetical protein